MENKNTSLQFQIVQLIVKHISRLLIIFCGLLITQHAYGFIQPQIPDYILPVGINLGQIEKKNADTTNIDYIVGAEISLIHFFENSRVMLGTYGDVITNTDMNDLRFSVGPEAAYLIPHTDVMIGVDGGYLCSYPDGKSGAVVRLFGSYLQMPLAPVIPYARYGFYPKDDYFYEYGVLLKFPIFLD